MNVERNGKIQKFWAYRHVWGGFLLRYILRHHLKLLWSLRYKKFTARLKVDFLPMHRFSHLMQMIVMQNKHFIFRLWYPKPLIICKNCLGNRAQQKNRAKNTYKKSSICPTNKHLKKKYATKNENNVQPSFSSNIKSIDIIVR